VASGHVHMKRRLYKLSLYSFFVYFSVPQTIFSTFHSPTYCGDRHLIKTVCRYHVSSRKDMRRNPRGVKAEEILQIMFSCYSVSIISNFVICRTTSSTLYNLYPWLFNTARVNYKYFNYHFTLSLIFCHSNM